MNKEIRDYQESMFWGLSFRQCLFSVLAILAALGIYFLTRKYAGEQVTGWLCILGAAPFAACGFFRYHGMTAEQFASSAMVDVSLKAYQHGESCEAAIPENNDDAIDHFTAEIQPGQTVNVCQAFTLTDESDVTVQAQEAFSFDEDATARQILKVK